MCVHLSFCTSFTGEHTHTHANDVLYPFTLPLNLTCALSLCRQIPLPDQPPWFLLFGASEEDLKEISCCILRLYSLQCESLAALQQQVEEMRSVLDAQYNGSKQAGLVSRTETPTAGFSPSSKAGGFIHSTRVSIQSYQCVQNWN